MGGAMKPSVAEAAANAAPEGKVAVKPQLLVLGSYTLLELTNVPAPMFLVLGAADQHRFSR